MGFLRAFEGEASNDNGLNLRMMYHNNDVIQIEGIFYAFKMPKTHCIGDDVGDARY
jgi:hypothetical protein